MEPQSFTRRQLYDLVWSEPIQVLAPRFGLSDQGLSKLCDRNAIPTPPRGYWAKKQAGHKVARIPMIELEGSRVRADLVVARLVLPPAPVEETGPDPLVSFWQAQRDEIGAIRVAKTLTNPHAVVAAWIADDERQRAVQARWGGYAPRSQTPLERRRLRLLSALYKTLEGLGVTIACERNARFAEVRHGRDHAHFDLKEYVAQKRVPLSDEERANSWGQKYRVEQTSTGLLRGKVDAYLPRGVPTLWTESAEKPFEDLLGEVAATILTALAQAKAQREEREETERQRWAQREAERQAQVAAKAQRKRKRALLQRVKRWRRAQDLLAYVAEVQAAVAAGRLTEDTQTLETWSSWALAHAAELDPIVAGDALETADKSDCDDDATFT